MTDLNTHQQYVTKWEKTHRIDSKKIKKNQHRAEPGGTDLRAQISGRVRQEVWKLKVYAGYKMGHKSLATSIHTQDHRFSPNTYPGKPRQEEEKKIISES